jgi:hypothetical protein
VETFFRPAIRLVNSLTYPQKIVIVSLLFLVPLVTIFYQMIAEIDNQIALARNERMGVEYCIRIQTLMDDLLQRALVAGANQNGEAATKAVLAGKDAAIDYDIKALNAENRRLGAAFKTADEWTAIVDRWSVLEGSEAGLSPQDSLSLQNGIIDNLLTLNTRVANASHLSMDTSMDSYYLSDTALGKLPLELEQSAQLTLAGVDMATNQSGNPDARMQLALTSGALKGSLNSLENNLQVIYQQNPGLMPKLDPARPGQARPDKLRHAVAERCQPGPGCSDDYHHPAVGDPRPGDGLHGVRFPAL